MTRKRRGGPVGKQERPVTADPNVLRMERLKPGETKGSVLASMLVAGLFPNAAAAREWSQFPFERDSDLAATLSNVVQAAERVNRGDLTAAVAVLTAQTVTLNAVFANLAFQATRAKDLDFFDRYLRLAFKAQSQCRATCETLALLKNPPVFARQANIAGQQVVNNGTITPPTRTREIQDAPKELLEGDGERLDGREACQTGEGDSRLAAVGAINRPPDSRG